MTLPYSKKTFQANDMPEKATNSQKQCLIFGRSDVASAA